MHLSLAIVDKDCKPIDEDVFFFAGQGRTEQVRARVDIDLKEREK